ncbi:E3 ubiquitin-protein ligase RBBP6-like [Danio rerio]|uniref:E3 ubiquitin-protein ligase RBBP6-like n=2 Tax=Danio rerio TaxID=7955 RepID=A0AC58GAL7_DANRE
MSCVHYRFQSRLTYDSLQFEGLNISAGELKRQIMRSKRLKFCQLKISNAQTDEEYTDDALIPKNTSVIIRRIPAAGLKSSTGPALRGGKGWHCPLRQSLCPPSFYKGLFTQTENSFCH